MLNALASLFFYARFLPSFSRLGYVRRARGFEALDFDFRGQRWVVSGATGGIGRAIALGAAAAGADVVALGRDGARLQALDAEGSGRIHGFKVDLASVAATRATASALARAGRVDVLVNNVGLMLHDFQRTAEGIEAGFATNLLNHFVLTEGLREAAALDARSAVISMSSGGLYGARLDLAALEARSAEDHNGLAAYAQHKRAQVELTRWWNGLGESAPRAYAMHPGWVDTEGVRSALPLFRRVLGRWLRSAEEGADTALWLAAKRPARAAAGGLWLDRQRETEHAFGFTRGGADAAALVAHLRRRLDAL
ncbi:SDR family NAD(P)-dependent oxidoreductase [Aquimonas voraii]|uniref:NAD(P)-dependent dehydrogenase, short-chain alcohol dehydrogenase family n=1 Tax=Aquimonas voraii TaxID=265719 RepID=A0A1G6X4Y7_9GAMM|nr:SDR family NAD(P)-dependent oxidoreductase [Aquimonas voraii]SDD73124.1 NAD(P)-dependent dehydrogenase, short-chain alcohol dehydrogenase family [Aquimonas voraii]